MKTSKIILALFIVQIFCLFIPQSSFGQTETLESVTFTPPKGWTKTPKEGAAVYTIIDKTTNAFCILTIYGSSPSAGNPNQDFTNEWNNLVIKPFKAQANPKTESQTSPEGWQATAGGGEIELSAGIKAIALLTVFSGFGKTVSVLTIFNDQSYLAQMQTFMDGIKLDKTTDVTKPLTQKSPDTATPDSDFLDSDPFPDKPHFQPQEPLIGRLRKTITMAHLAGKWSNGGASIQEYVTSSTQSQTSVSFGRTDYTIRADGTYESKSQSRASNTTIRESESGTITLSDSFIIKKSSTGPKMRYQFVSFMELPNGSAVLTVIYIGDDAPLDGNQLMWNCGHAHGYITCSSGENWVRTPK